MYKKFLIFPIFFVVRTGIEPVCEPSEDTWSPFMGSLYLTCFFVRLPFRHLTIIKWKPPSTLTVVVDLIGHSLLSTC